MSQRLEGKLPIVAILRGLEPARAVAVAEVLVDAGLNIIEVPLNSPDPFQSIGEIVRAFGDRALVGAGTVLNIEQVDRLADLGAGLVVSPNCNPAVIARTVARGMVSLPGVFTPTEMFAALTAGATGLKIFPAELVPPVAVKAVKAVLPPSAPVYVVGGINDANMAEYLEAGATGFGVGGSLFRPGKMLADIAADARTAVRIMQSLTSGKQ